MTLLRRATPTGNISLEDAFFLLPAYPDSHYARNDKMRVLMEFSDSSSQEQLGRYVIFNYVISFVVKPLYPRDVICFVFVEGIF